MSDKRAIEMIKELSDHVFVTGLLSFYDTESPIEKLAYASLLYAEWSLGSENLSVLPQVEIDNKYRVDFLVHHRLMGFSNLIFNGNLSIVVECDGHEFHEKTKEQAEKDKKRDRFFAEKGYKVLRFTGSEIVRNPEVVSNSVLDVIRNHYNRCAVLKLNEMEQLDIQKE